jgi:hypothetical protein
MSGDSGMISEMNQLKAIKDEIKRTLTHLKDLRAKKSQIESRILTHLDRTKRKGAKNGTLLVMAEEKVQRDRKREAEKEQDIISVLSTVGVKNVKDTYEKIINAMKGQEHLSKKLVVKDVKKT